MNKDVIRKVYDAMSKEYDMAEDFDTFAQDIQNKDVARRVYDAMYDRYRMEEDFEEFYKDLTFMPSVDGVKTTESGSVVVDEVPKQRRINLADTLNASVPGMATYSYAEEVKEEQEKNMLTQEEKDQRAAMRERLQADGTIDLMEGMKEDAREAKRKTRREAIRYGLMAAEGVAPQDVDLTSMATEHRQNKLLQEKLDVALDMARAGEVEAEGLLGFGAGLGLGIWDSATRLSTWDMGFSDIANNATLQQIVEKWENDPSSLTATEQKVLEGIGMATAVQELYSDQVGVGYNVGQSLPESASFMMGMALNPASGLGKSLARNAVRTYGRNSIRKNLARIGGDFAETAIMTATTGAGRVAADALERINGSSTYEIGENGVIMYGGQKDQETVGNAVIKAIGANFIENYSEALGEYFDPLLGMSRKVAAGGLRKMNLNKWADALSDVQPSQMTASIRALREKTKFGGIFGEIMEEEIGMALNTLFVGDNQWSDFVDLETQLTTVLSCAIMSGTLNGVEQVSSVAARRRMEKNAKNAERSAANAFGEQFSELRESIDQASPEGVVDVLRDVYMDQGYSLEQKRKLAEYAAARLQMQYYNAADAKARREVNKTQQGVLDAYEAGRHAQLPTYYNIEQEYRNSEEAINASENAENIWAAIETLNRAPLEEHDMIINDFSEEEQQLIRQYRYNAARVLGAVNSRAEQAEDLIDEYRGQIAPFTKPDGTVTTAILGDNVVFVMEQNENGDAVVYTNDGRKIFAKTRDLEHVETHNAEDLVERFRQSTNEAMDIETENAFEHHPKTQTPQVGLQLQSPEGEVVITAVNDNMVEIVPAVYRGGQVQPKEGAEPRTITVDDAYAWQDDYYLSMDADQAYANAMAEANNVSAETTENESTPTEEIEQSVSEEVTDGQNGYVGRTMTQEEADAFIPQMVQMAEPSVDLEFTPENWIAEFGEEGVVPTPIGAVKMGENQYFKLSQKKRTAYFGMVKPTLTNPDLILEEYDPKEEAERDTKLIFVKTFVKPDGSRTVNFESVTVKKGDLEVSISSHEIDNEQLFKKVQQDKLLHLNEKFSSSELRLTEPQQEGSDLVPSPNSISSNVKGSGNVSDVQVNGQENVVEDANIDASINKTARERVPKDKKGNPIYEQTDADTAWDAIVEETEGDTEMAQRVAADMLEDKKAALAKLQNGKPKKGATVAEKIANEKAHQAAIAQAQNDVVQWEAIVGTETRRREAAMSEADRYAAGMEQKSVNEGLAALGEPQSLEEYVLGQLAGGSYKLRWSDKENGTKGFGSHTGLSTEEMKARLSMIDNKNGLTPEEVAHSIVENMDASFGEVDVMDVTNMVIDAVSTHASRRSMLNEMVESRAEMMRQQERADQEARDAWYMEQYHATEEELALYNEYLETFAEEIYGEDADYEQRIATFAEIQLEEYDNQGTDAGIRSSANQGEGLASDREGGRSVGETEQLDRREVLADAEGLAEAEDGRAGGSVSAQSDVEDDGERDYQEHLSSVIYEIESELGVLTADNAETYAKALFDNFHWETLEEAADALKRIFKLQNGEVNSLAVLPYLDAAQKEARKLSRGLATERRELPNGDVMITNYDSNGNLAAVSLERDGKVVAVGTYEDGALFEHTDYDENGQATKVTRYKNGEVISEQEYKDGKRKVTANVFEMAEEAQKKRKTNKKKDDKQTNQNLQEERKEGAATTGADRSRPNGTFSISYYTQFLKELFQNAHWEERPSEEVAGIIRRHNAGKMLLARTGDERELLSALRALTNNEIQDELSNINNALQSDEYTDEEKEELKRAKNLITRFVNRGERNAVIEALTGAKLGEKLPLSKIDELFEMYNSDADVAELYRRVRAIAEQIGLDFWFEEMEDRLLGGYLHSDNRVRLNARMLYCPRMQRQGVASTIVHEMLHAVAGYAVYTQKDIKLGLTPKVQLSKQVLSAANTIINIYEKAVKGNPALVHQEYDIEKEEWVEVADYGTTSVHEMLSEISNPDFRDKLKQIEYKGRSVWQRIWDAIRSMFIKSSDVTNPTAYDSMANALDVLINEFSVDAYQKYSGFEESAMKLSADDNLRFRDGAPFFSNAERAVEKITQNKATPEQWLAMIKKDGGLKAGEDKWMGLSDWLNEQKENGVKSLTKDEVLQFIRANQIEIEEVEYLGNPVGFDELKEEYEAMLRNEGYDAAHDAMVDRFGDDFDIAFNDLGGELVIANEDAASALLGSEKIINPTRMDYTTAGLDNKKEIAFVVPSIEPWNEGDEIHFGDAGEGRAVVWARFGETTDADGNRLLVIDEVQSKRHDEGRAKGYQSTVVLGQYKNSKEAGRKTLQREVPVAEVKNRDTGEVVAHIIHDGNLYYTVTPYNTSQHVTEEDALRRAKAATSVGAIPDAPFAKNYHELAMKRMLRYAAENGFDKVAWTKGAQQAERYGLGTKVNKIKVSKTKDGSRAVSLYFKDNGFENFHLLILDKDGYVKEGDFQGRLLSDVVGKDMAERLMSAEDGKEFQGDGLIVGGEDRNALYDEMIPRFMNKYTKKWGTKVGEVTLPKVEEAGRTMWSVDVTPEMKESVMQGQPMFREGMGAISDREVSYENDPVAKVLGKPRYYGKRAAAFAERERRRMENAAKEAAEMLGIEAEIVTDASTLQGRKAKAKGWYDIVNKKVVVVVPNHVSMGDAVRTVLHEGIAHHGLRELFGDGFDAMLDNVYNNVDAELKARIDAIAERTGVSTSVATEEYMASLAETTNFEEAQRRGWWQQIKQFFAKMLNKLSMPGIKLKDELTDNELRYILWRSYKNLVEPNSYLKPLGYAEDVVKQKELKVGQYAEAEEMSMASEEGLRYRSKDSTRRQERNRINNNYENAVSLLFGIDKKKVREERIAREKKRREDAKEIYDSVLSGDFNDVTLRKINDYIDDATPRNPFGRRISQRLPQKLERSLHEGARTNAVDALFSRISESAVPANERISEAGRRKAEERKKELLKGWAIATGNWHTDLSAFVDDTTPIGEGTDSKVYLAKDGAHVIKASKGKPYGKRFRPDMDNIALFNRVFYNSRYEIVGYGEIDGEFVRILKQPIVDFTGTTPLTPDERVEYMKGLKFEPINDSKTAFSNGEIVISDLQKSNIIKDAAGNVRVIDADAKLHTKDVGGNYTYPPVEADLPQEEDSQEKNRLRYREGDDTKLMDALADAYASGDAAAIQDAVNDIMNAIRLDDADPSIGNLDWEKVENYNGTDPRLLAAQYIVRAQHHLYLDEDYDTEYIKTGIKTVDAPVNETAEEDISSYTNDLKNEQKEAQRQFEERVERSQNSSAKGVWLWNGLMSVEEIQERHQSLIDEFENLLSTHQFDKAADKLGEIRAWQNAAKRHIDNLYSETPYVGEDILIAEIERESAALGVPVRIARSVDELPDDTETRKRAEDGSLKGVYSTIDGEVVVYLPNTENANDAKRTILHEIVGHKGLRQLIGEQQYDKAMLQLMYMLPADVRDAVLRRAERHGWNAAIAMDEYLAEQAERDVQPTWWGKVNAKIRALLRNLGFDVKLTDSDVTYLLWRSRKKLQGDDLNDMAVNSILKQAARKSAEADAWNEQAFKDAEMRDFERNTLPSVRHRMGADTNDYEKAVRTLGFKQAEAWQDSMRSLLVFQQALAKASGKDISDFENAYMYENRMSSANLMEMEQYRHMVYNPLLKEIHELEQMGASRESIINYLFAKSGLERNEVFARRDAKKQAEGDATKEQQLYDKYRQKDYAGLTALTAVGLGFESLRNH